MYNHHLAIPVFKISFFLPPTTKFCASSEIVDYKVLTFLSCINKIPENERIILSYYSLFVTCNDKVRTKKCCYGNTVSYSK